MEWWGEEVLYRLANYTAVFEDLMKSSHRCSTCIIRCLGRLCVLCFQNQTFRFLFYFIAAGVKYRMAVVKRLPIFHHGPDCKIIFLFHL